ncbi:DNA methyltransferase [Vibrio metoecus]|uniref:Cytosine-specific methyltransferase n=1 Tax=Vibrio metoecus TaxID=1481663 RepID=A0A0N8UHZ8_VIBMT|nr:DNA methyltransferase [Vibrio metoecus]
MDLFAGIGGVRLGFQQNGGACVFSSEFDKHAQQTYKNNHGEVPFGDITKIPANEIPDHDVLLAGFPCQPFSHAGLKLGIDDTRGTLFHDIANILETKKPKFALLENVKGLISHDKGYTLKVILKTLTRIGYSCNIPKKVIEYGTTKEIQTLAKEMVLKSVDFGRPQNRQRIYIVLWRDGEIDKFEYPKPLDMEIKVGDILEEKPDPKLTISDRLWEGHQRRKIENKKNGKGFGFGLVTKDSPYTNTISARYYKDGSEVLIAQTGKNPRKISPREAARLQGFPDEFEPSISKVQAYKQFGNSVTVDVVRALAKCIVSFME